MKIGIQTLGLLLWMHVSRALVVNHPAPAGEKLPSFMSHPESPDLSTPTLERIVVEGFEDGEYAPRLAKIFTPTLHYARAQEIAVRELEERQGVCLYVATCAGMLKDYAAYYAFQAWSQATSYCSSAAVAISDYYTANNYAHAFAVLDGSTSSIFLLIPTNTITYYFTARIAKIEGTSTKETCALNQGQVVVEQTANAFYQFCLGIKNEAIERATTRYTAGSMSTSSPYFDESDGLLIVKKFYIGSNEFDIAETCHSYGIQWRRDFNAALDRGRNRSISKKRMSVSKG